MLLVLQYFLIVFNPIIEKRKKAHTLITIELVHKIIYLIFFIIHKNHVPVSQTHEVKVNNIKHSWWLADLTTHIQKRVIDELFYFLLHDPFNGKMTYRFLMIGVNWPILVHFQQKHILSPMLYSNFMTSVKVFEWNDLGKLIILYFISPQSKQGTYITLLKWIAHIAKILKEAYKWPCGYSNPDLSQQPGLGCLVSMISVAL